MNNRNVCMLSNEKKISWYQNKTFLLIICVPFLFLSCKYHKAEEKNKFTEKIQSTLEQLVNDNEIPGINFSIIDGNDTQYDFSAGYENIVSKKKMDTSFFMLSGSIGKTYVTTLILQLVDEKKIKLDDKILKYLPDEKWLDSLPNINNITIRMLLSHTSGLPRWVTKPEVWNELYQHKDKIWSYKDRLEVIFNDDPVHEVDKGWSYSDTNYLLLGFLLESVEQKGYYDILRLKILEPEGLSKTAPANKRSIPNLAMGYSNLPESFRIPKQVLLPNGEFIFNPQMEWTGGGMASTTSDLAKWGKIFYSANILSDSLKGKITRINPNGKNVYKSKHSYGMGSFIYETKYGMAYGHSGLMPGYNSIMFFYPKYNLALAVQINCDCASKKMDLIEYIEKLMDSYMG